VLREGEVDDCRWKSYIELEGDAILVMDMGSEGDWVGESLKNIFVAGCRCKPSVTVSRRGRE
jgi:hypothetical protein